MKIALSKTFISVSSLLLVASAFANEVPGSDDSVWVGRLTSQKQCIESFIQPGELRQVISDLELKTNSEAKQSLVGRLEGTYFCSACGCPKGSFFFAKLAGVRDLNDVPKTWKVVSPADIVQSEVGDGDLNPQPIAPVSQ